MLSLLELSEEYKKNYPHYINPLASLTPQDDKLEEIKRKALLPYLKNLEGELIIYRNLLTTFGILFDIKTNDSGFQAELWMFNIIDFPDYIQPTQNERQSTIKCSWRFMRLLNHRINCMPNGLVLWPEESFVNEIEKIYLLKGKKTAHVAIAQTSRISNIDGLEK